jgi:DNA excision repair protein ERCC-8
VKETSLLKRVLQATASVSGSSRGESLRVHQQGEQQHSRLNTPPPIRRKFRAKDFEAQRQHPGMVSTLDKATAHYGSVTALQTTDDGLYLFSAGMALLTASGSCYSLSCIYNIADSEY